MKICTICKVNKTRENFAKNRSRSDGIQNICRPCKKKYDAVYFQKYKQEQLVRNRKHRKEQRLVINEAKAKIGCAFCEEFDFCCLDFHHCNGDKKQCVSTMFGRVGIEKLWAEIEKCEVVCANCHRKLHAGRKLKRRRPRNSIGRVPVS